MNINDIKARWDRRIEDTDESQYQEDIGELLRTVERLEGALEKIASLPDTWVRATGDYADIAHQALKKEA